MRAVRGCIWTLLTLGLVLPLGGPGSAQTAQKQTHKVIIYPSANESIEQLRNQGITNVDNYGSFWVAETDDAQRDALEKSHGDRVARGDYLNRIELSSVALDTTAGEPRFLPSSVRPLRPGKRLRLIQFKGPVRPEWLDQVKAAGKVKVVTYIPNNAYLLSLDEQAEANLSPLMVPADRFNGSAAIIPITNWRGSTNRSRAHRLTCTSQWSMGRRPTRQSPASAVMVWSRR